ncbi:OLC1v1036737C1 [Oldenlandia corymbosa var. corymbosa]|uniref:OLC1v1036737C1 n=1 Tax=Oldenlandia corymbosa var. corymbosa TaxID=529605 RepID=A0AAV1CY47_OLDCO|nr:OLC1v1036737C1 [Oldenlandia corymbosa var. corymbosa]
MEIISKEFIRPSSPTPFEKKDHKLSLLDQFSSHYFIPFLFFYPKQSPHSKDVNFDDPSKTTLYLKQSLSESLTKFYPLAGKLNPNRRAVSCDDSGVLFVEAKFDASLSQAVQAGPCESFSQYLPFEPVIGGRDDKLLPSHPKEQIVFAVQITWFRCGGNAIGVCMSHKVADFSSLVMFLDSWSALNRGETVGSVPNFDLGRKIFPPLDRDVGLPNLVRLEEDRKVGLKRIVFGKEKLLELKKLATSSHSPASSPVVNDPTRVEVVTAFLWKHFINVERAKNQGGCAKQIMFNMWHAVNLRSRMSKLAASSISCNGGGGDDDDDSINDRGEFPFGNFAISTKASFISNENDEAGAKDFGDLVRLTSDAFKIVNEDFVLNCAVPLLKTLDDNRITEILWPPTMMMSHSMFTSWCRFPLYEMDFGWGKPTAVGVAGQQNRNVVFLMDTNDGEGIEAWMAIPEDDELTLLPDDLLSDSPPIDLFSSAS